MAISPVYASNGTVTATQALRPQQSTDSVRQASNEAQHDSESGNLTTSQAPAAKPTVNTNGETIGTILNITA